MVDEMNKLYIPVIAAKQFQQHTCHKYCKIYTYKATKNKNKNITISPLLTRKLRNST